MTRRPPSLPLPWIHLIVILVLVFLVYIPALSVPWYYDDFSYAVHNWRLSSWDGIKYIVANFIYRGLVLLSYALDSFVSNKLDFLQPSTETVNPWNQPLPVYHLSSVLYHLLNMVGIFLLVRKVAILLEDQNERGSWPGVYLPMVVALLYGLHPIHTEAVTYLSGRASILATLAYVFAMYSLLIAAERFGLFDKNPQERSRLGRAVGAYALFWTVICFVLGIGSKEIIVTMPVTGIFILALLVTHRYSFRIAIKRLAPFCALVSLLLMGFFVYRVQALGGIIGFEEARVRPWWVNLLSQIGVVSLYYLPRQLCLLPLCIDPQVPEIYSVFHPNVIFGIITLGGLMTLGVRYARRAPLVAIGLGWYFITLLPTSSIIPLNDLAAERRTYLPDIGLALAFAALLGQATRNLRRPGLQNPTRLSKALVLGVGCLCVVLAALTVQRNLLYTHPLQFWLDTERHSPDKRLVHFQVAREYYSFARKYLDAQQYQEADNALRETLLRFSDIPPEYRPTYADAAIVLGVIFMTKYKQYHKAAALFELCIRRWPDRSEVWNNLGICYLKTGESAKAEKLARRWFEKEPDSVLPRVLFANALYMEGDIDQARTYCLQILRKYGEVSSALGLLADIAQSKGDTIAARNYMARAVASWPADVSKPTEVDGMPHKIHIIK